MFTCQLFRWKTTWNTNKNVRISNGLVFKWFDQSYGPTLGKLYHWNLIFKKYWIMVVFQISTAMNIWILETFGQQTFACSLLRSPLHTASLLDNSWWGLDQWTNHQQRWFLSAEAGSHFHILFRISICAQKQDPSSSGLSCRPPQLLLRACKFPAKYWHCRSRLAKWILQPGPWSDQSLRPTK